MKSESAPGWSALLALQRATHATLQVLSAELADLDLTASEINALANLADGRGRTVSELGAAAGTRPTTLTSVLDRLERRGYITRGPAPETAGRYSSSSPRPGIWPRPRSGRPSPTWSTARSTACQTTRSPACARPCKP